MATIDLNDIDVAEVELRLMARLRSGEIFDLHQQRADELNISRSEAKRDNFKMIYSGPLEFIKNQGKNNEL